MGEMNVVNPVIVYYYFFEAVNDAFEVQLFQGFISTPY